MNVDAAAVGTLAWLTDLDRTIAVPVYQRQYRWEISDCAQLLSDIRAVADADERERHFLGSILSSSGTSGELVLIDGQQRLTTLMLLIAALRHSIGDRDPQLASELERALVTGPGGVTTLRPHRAWAGVFEAVIRGAELPADGGARFEENYTFFRSEVDDPDEVARLVRGLTRLEHVAITLGPDSNVQQIFESLNSTGAPLRDHELIHNYLLMGLGHDEQLEIEDRYWIPIERATGAAIDEFFRDYLTQRTGREGIRADRAVYDAFRAEFPYPGVDGVRALAAELAQAARVYGMLLDPSTAPDAGLGGRFADLALFGRGMRPLALLATSDHLAGRVDRATLLDTLDRVLSLLLRRTIVGTDRTRLVARLCRTWRADLGGLDRAFARITPSDLRVRLALRYRPLPLPAYVLGRVLEVDARGLEVEHVFPLGASSDWTGDGVREFRDFSEDEQNSLRAIQSTLGNLTLIEPELREAAEGRSFPAKRDIYARSQVAATRALADESAWTSRAISERTGALAARVTELWAHPASGGIDDDDLTPILDARRRSGWYDGWQAEFEYVQYRGEHWEVYDVKALMARIFARMWADHPDRVLEFSARHRGPVFAEPAWRGEWRQLGDSHWLFVGYYPQHLLELTQDLLSWFGVAEEVFVKYEWGMAER